MLQLLQSGWLQTRLNATRLSYADSGSCAKKEPARAMPFMARAGGGWIVTGLIVMDRFRV
jgi:hypothetical protein